MKFFGSSKRKIYTINKTIFRSTILKRLNLFTHVIAKGK